MMSSPGSTARRARTTVRPPTPESKTPIGLRLYVLSCHIKSPRLRRPVTAGDSHRQGNYRFAQRKRLKGANASGKLRAPRGLLQKPTQAAGTSQVYHQVERKTC